LTFPVAAARAGDAGGVSWFARSRASALGGDDRLAGDGGGVPRRGEHSTRCASSCWMPLTSVRTSSRRHLRKAARSLARRPRRAAASSRTVLTVRVAFWAASRNLGSSRTAAPAAALTDASESAGGCCTCVG